jgi:hypothetical protein
MNIGPPNIVPFICALCGAQFNELNGRKCSRCGKLACRYHFFRGWVKGQKGICSGCLSPSKEKSNLDEKK